MKLEISEISNAQAKKITEWQYNEPYNIYNGSGSDNEVEEILSNNYFAVNNNNDLIGFYCYGKSAQVPAGNEVNAYADSSYIDIGIGLKPELCGKGYGYNFFSNAIKFAQELGHTKIRLTVASFNTRAIRVYENVGFKKQMQFYKQDNSLLRPFTVMILK
ncbi:GNAT family N-acetyltransferase [Clostridium sp. 'deep sea']|uniref:GNAT family N-acetyltransferase n=1 Tax=Clostridium sp. 'deep sea' TaxID=2779445 RepID=UPI0018965885|nr:GNAT family protein [Clostridium sp. 'deep sea']QOR35010.1 GNAT family N-acetyltransferase [Clostridium sp. 'deep sea']